VPPVAARTFALALVYAAGVVLADTAAPSATFALLVGGFGLSVVLGSRRGGALLAAGLAVGFALAGLRLASVEQAELAAGARESADALLEGEALTDGRGGRDSVRFVLGVRLAEIDGDPRRLRERAWVTIRPPPARPVTAGQIMRLDARLRPVRLPDMDTDGLRAATRLRRRGIAARAFAGPDDIELLGRSRNPLTAVADAGRRAARRAAARLGETDQGLLLGVTIGDTSRLEPQTDLDFRATGLTHLLAVSGANVAMVLAVIALVLRAARAGRRLTLVVLACSTVAFMAITRFEASVLRAGVMALIVLGGIAVGARRQALNVLGVATVVLLVVDPLLVFEAGFQLSVLATLGILAISPVLAARLPPGPLGAATAVTVGAQLAVAPLIALQFRQLSLIALAANLLVAPAVGPATVIGMIAALAGAAWEPFAGFAVAAAPALAWMRWIARVLATLPLASISTPGGALGMLGAVTLALAAIALARGRHPRRVAPILLSAALVATGGVWARALGPTPLHGMVITMLDVGQGEAIVLRAGGRTMLVDGGPEEAPVLRGLRAEGVHRIDLLAISHPHADHVVGLVGVAEALPVARALDPMIDNELAEHARLRALLEQRGVPVDRARAGLTYRLGDAVIELLWPPEPLVEGTEEDTNNNSIVFRARYGSQSILYAGETQEEAQQELLEQRAAALPADVLKVSHHGSRRMVPAFYQASGARAALIPVGPNNYGHPATQTLLALEGMTVLRSDDHGTVSVALDGRGGVEIRTERRPAAALSLDTHEGAHPDPVGGRVPGLPRARAGARPLDGQGVRRRGGRRRRCHGRVLCARHAVAVRRRAVRHHPRHRPAARPARRPVRRLG